MNTMVRYRNGSSLINQMDDIFENMLGSIPETGIRRPAVDVREEADSYILEAELPGYQEDEINVTIEDSRLKIDAVHEKEAKKVSEENAEPKYLLRERRPMHFSRSFGLPRDVDQKAISASYTNGVLTLVMKKSEEAKPRTIKIN